MNTGGPVAYEDMLRSHGGLIATVGVPKATGEDNSNLHETRAIVYSAIESSIFRTVYLRWLDPGNRVQHGALYIHREDFKCVVNPQDGAAAEGLGIGVSRHAGSG
jgi:hypothetical protein